HPRPDARSASTAPSPKRQACSRLRTQLRTACMVRIELSHETRAMPKTTSRSVPHLALVMAILGWAATACVAPTNPPPTTSPIKIGVLDDTTGVTSIEGALMRISTDLAVQQTNASGGINGRPIQPVYVDSKDDPTQALQLAAQLVDQDQVDVLA